MTKPTIKEIDISELKFDPNNARKRTPLSSQVIAKSLEEFGACRSGVMDEHGVIRAGNGTLKEAIDAGIEKALVVETDGKTLVVVKRSGFSDEQWKQYAIADNTASDFSTWDVGVLNAIASEVDLSEFFPDEKLNELLESLGDRSLLEIEPDEPEQDNDTDESETNCKCPKCGFSFIQKK